MNQTEKRRKLLLEQTRNLYSDQYNNPAVHPRYRVPYQKIYMQEPNIEKDTFATRIVISIVLLGLFLSMKYYGTTIGGITNLQVINEIMQNIV